MAGMMRLAVPALVFLVAACGASADPAATVATPEGYREAAAAFDSAIAAKDEAALQRLIADDFLWVRGSGAMGDKAAFIAALAAPSIRIEPFRPAEPRWITSGDSALLAATNRLQGTADGEPFVDRHRFADHWLWRDGAWQLVYAQVTPVPEAAAADVGGAD
jgi:ketosteroid isomerase-like protein